MLDSYESRWWIVNVHRYIQVDVDSFENTCEHILHFLKIDEKFYVKSYYSTAGNVKLRIGTPTFFGTNIQVDAYRKIIAPIKITRDGPYAFNVQGEIEYA